MTIYVLRGRSGTGKTAFLEQKIVENDLQDKSSIVIVSDQVTFEMEMRLMNLLGGGLLNTEVLGFPRLANRILNETGGANRLFLSDDGKKMVLRNIIEENESQLTLFKKLGPRTGFVDQLLGFFKSMKFGQVDAQTLSTLSAAIEDPLLSYKLQDIAFLYDKLSQFMAGNYIDLQDAQNLLIEQIGHSSFIKQSDIFLDGLTAKLFSQQGLCVIEQLFLHSPNCYIAISLCDEDDSDHGIFAQQASVYEKIIKIAHATNQPIQEITCPISSVFERTVPTGISNVERHLFSYDDSCFIAKEADGVFWLEAQSQQEEVEQAAYYIDELIRDGAACNDICIAMGDSGVYGPLLKRALAHLPVFLDESRLLASHGVVEFVLSSLKVLLHQYRYDDVMRVIKSGFANLSVDEAEQLENYANEFGINFSRWLNPFTKIHTNSKKEITEEDQEKLRIIEMARQKVINPLQELQKNMQEATTTSGCAKAMFMYWEEVALRERLDDLCSRWGERGEWDFVRENAQVWHILLELLDQMATLMDGPCDIKRFHDLFEEGCVAHKIGMIPALADQIVLSDVARLSLRSCQHVLVLGCNEGMIPALPAETGLIDDRDIAQMRVGGIDIVPDQAENTLMDRHSIYSLFSRAEKSLYISWAKSSQEGELLYESEIAQRMQALFPNSKRQYVMHRIDTALSKENGFTQTQAYLRQALEHELEETKKEELFDALQYYQQDNQYQKRLEDDRYHLFDPQQGMQAQNIVSSYPSPRYSSISRLENFNSCPFKHYVTHGLRPLARKPYQENSLDMGNYYHEAFDVFTKQVKNENRVWADLKQDECDKMMENILNQIEEEHNNAVLRSTAQNRAKAHIMRSTAKKTCLAMVRQIQLGEFEPYASELKIGGTDEKDLPPLRLELRDGSIVELHGVIDRVDLFSGEDMQYFRIIDYKSGKSTFSYDKLYYGLQMQLPIYCESLRQNLGESAGMFYMHIASRVPTEDELSKAGEYKTFLKTYELKGILLDKEEVIHAMDRDNTGIVYTQSKSKTECFLPIEQMNGVLDYALEQAASTAEAILSGDTKANPFDFGEINSCTYCDYASICRLEASREGRFRSYEKNGKQYILENKEDII